MGRAAMAIAHPTHCWVRWGRVAGGEEVVRGAAAYARRAGQVD